MSNTLTNNPLLNIGDLPKFSEIQAKHVVPAIQHLLSEHKKNIITLLKSLQEPTWENLMLPLEQMGNQLDRSWSPISHLNAVVNSEDLRTAYDECLSLLSDYGTWLGQNQSLYKATKALYENRDNLELNSTQIKILEDELRDFKLSGVSLSEDKQKRYSQIQKRLSELSSKFEQNLLDATMEWSKHYETKEGLEGLPISTLDLLKHNLEQKNLSDNTQLEGYLLNLEYPCYHAVMTHADNEQLRYEIYRAYTTRASQQSESQKFCNKKIMDELIELRDELAKLLEFNDYAELSLASKMAESKEQVLGFLYELAENSKNQAEKELAELQEFAKKELGLYPLKPWDIMYASEKLKLQRYSLSQEELRRFFPVDKVLNGLFDIVHQLYSISVKEVTEPFERWHSDVRLFEIYNNEGAHVARFYLDLYARGHKRGGAWMADFCSRFRFSNGDLQAPVAFLTCNFNPPIGGKTTLLTHDDVVTLFHEFGHGLHHMLTQIEYLGASGIRGVEWDAVELPSQFMENFCYQKEGLDKISEHYETGLPLPEELRQKLLDAKNFQSAMQMLRQLEFSLFDFRIHCEYKDNINHFIQDTLDNVREHIAVVIPPSWNRFQHSFSHIFAGGYSAGYYSYKWAEVLSADAFAKFEEDGVFNKSVGYRFLKSILQKGGSQPAMKLFKDFRGREPSIDALLKHSGIG